MAKKNILELRGFFKGTISSMSEHDIPQEAASSSMNLDPRSNDGELKGLPADNTVSYQSLKSMKSINDSGKIVVAGVTSGNRVLISDNFLEASPTNAFTTLSSKSAESLTGDPVAVKYGSNMLFGMGNGENDDVLYVGKDKHRRFGNDPTNNYFVETAELTPGVNFGNMTKVINIGDTWFGLVRDGTTIYKFTKTSSGVYKYHSSSTETFHQLKTISLHIDGLYFWVVEKESDGDWKFHKMSVSDMSKVSSDTSINEWLYYDGSGWETISTASSFEINDIYHHKPNNWTGSIDMLKYGAHTNVDGMMFITLRYTNANSYQYLLFIKGIGNGTAYDNTPHFDQYNNAIGSFKLSDINTGSLVQSTDATLNGQISNVAWSGIDNSSTQKKVFWVTDDGSEVKLYCRTYSEDANGAWQSVNNSDAGSKTLDNSGNYTIYRTDDGIELTGNNRTKASNCFTQPPAIIDTERKILLIGLNPETGYEGDAKIYCVNYTDAGALDTNNTVVDVLSGDHTASGDRGKRESAIFSYNQSKGVVLVALRRPVAISVYNIASGGDYFIFNPASDTQTDAFEYATGASGAVVENFDSAQRIRALSCVYNSNSNVFTIAYISHGSESLGVKYVVYQATHTNQTISSGSYNGTSVLYRHVNGTGNGNNSGGNWNRVNNFTSSTKPMQLIQPDAKDNRVYIRYNSSVLSQFSPTTSGYGSITEVYKKDTTDSLLTNVGTSVLGYIEAIARKNTLIFHDLHDGVDDHTIRIYEVNPGDGLLDARGSLAYEPSGGSSSNETIKSVFVGDGDSNTAIVSEAGVLTWIDWTESQKALNTPEGNLIAADSDTVGMVIDWGKNTEFRYATNSFYNSRLSLIYLQFNNAAQIDDNTSNGLLGQLMVSGTRLEHSRISETFLNVNSVGYLVDGNTYYLAVGGEDDGVAKIYYQQTPGLSTVTDGHTFNTLKVREFTSFSKITPNWRVESGTHVQLNAFEYNTNGNWRYALVAKSGLSDTGVVKTQSSSFEILPELTSTTTNNFLANTEVRYKFSITYDGFQESPLSEYFDIAQGSTAYKVKCTLRFWGENNLSKRATSINIYRNQNDSTATEAFTYFRFVKNVPFDTNWDTKTDSSGEDYREFIFTDSGKMGSTYESNTGLNEDLETSIVRFSVGCIFNGSLFTGNGSVSGLDDESNYIFKSQIGKPSMTDWSRDFVILPEVPTAIQGHHNRVVAFSNNSLYRIEPNRMILEDIYEGVGCYGQRSVVSTDMGLFFADNNSIYTYDGMKPVAISGPIEKGMSKAYDSRDKTYLPILEFDSYRKSILVFVKHGTTYGILTFNIPAKRWDYVKLATGDANAPLATTQVHNGNTYYSHASQILNMFKSTSTRDWFWVSKKLNMLTPERKKKFYYITKTGSADVSYTINGSSWTDTRSDTIVKFPNDNRDSQFLKIKVENRTNYTTDTCDSIGVVYKVNNPGSSLGASAVAATYPTGGEGGGGGEDDGDSSN